jgi:tetratricopeptide (TPR) repeat protein
MERAIKNCGMKGNERLWFQVLVSERKFQDAFAVAGTPLMRAELYFYLGDRDRMLASADSARIDLAKKSAREPEDHLWHLRLGTALAYLGTSDKALREAEMGRALMSPDKDAMDGPVVLHQIARILLLAGDIDGALDTIETALEASDELSVQILRQHPFWDSLRGNPRFEKLIAAD